MQQGKKNSITRRGFMRSSAAATAVLAAPAILGANKAFAGQSLIVRDWGGTYTDGFKKAFYDPFTKETGVSIQVTTNDPDPVPQLKMAVDTNTRLFDVGLLNPEHIIRLHGYGDKYLLPLNLQNIGPKENFVPDTFGKDYAGVAVYALAMGYRTDTFPKNGPSSWQDFWNVNDFKGRRGLWRSPVTTLEMALVADGVPLDQLYPLDVDRAFKSLDKIKDHIDVWWTSGAQNSQVLQNGEVDLTATWSTRAQAAINDGAPVEIVWNGGLYNIDAWTIPGNCQQADLARKFIEFTMDPKRQAIYTDTLAAGPTNMKAYDTIDAKLAKILPTTPDHIKGLTMLNADYWAKNQEPLTQQFEQWILA